MPRLSRRDLLRGFAGLGLLALAGCGGEEVRPLVASPVTGAWPDTGLLTDAAWLAARGDDPTLRLIDCSPLADYGRGHLPGAVHVWWQDTIEVHNPVYGMLTGLDVRSRLIAAAGITDTSTVVGYDNAGGVYAARFLWLLHASGFRATRLLDGGASAWLAAGHELTRAEPDPSPGGITLQPDESVIAHAHDIRTPGAPDYLVLDTRTDAERRATWYGKLRRGTIPGAVWVPRERFLTGDPPSLAPPDQLRRDIEASGVSLATAEVVVFGLHGTLAALPWLALRALGVPRVRLYDGGWAEWGADPALPIAPVDD